MFVSNFFDEQNRVVVYSNNNKNPMPNKTLFKNRLPPLFVHVKCLITSDRFRENDLVAMINKILSGTQAQALALFLKGGNSSISMFIMQHSYIADIKP